MSTVGVQVVSVSGAALPSDLEVDLFVFEDMTQVFSKTLTISEGGLAVIDNLPLAVDQMIFATTDHQGVVYGSEIAVIEPELNSVNLSIPYYEPTQDLSILQAERLHIFYEFLTDETIQVYVLYIFSNTSDKVLAAGNSTEPVLVFEIPVGASNLQRDTGMEFQDVDLPNGFGLLSVYPAAEQYQVLYSFELPYDKNKVDFDLPIGLDTSAVIVMIPEGGLEVESDQLIEAGMRDIEGVSYNMYNGSNLEAGDFLNMTVSGKPKLASPDSLGDDGDTSTGFVIGLAAFGAMLIGAGLYFWYRNRKNERDWDGLDDDFAADSQANDDPDAVLDAIITLDDLYQSGEIPRDAYLTRRTDLKEKLRKLVG
jgi:hypothetical protein